MPLDPLFSELNVRKVSYLLKESSTGTEILFLTIFDKSEADTIKKSAAVKLKNYVLESMGLAGKIGDKKK